MIQKRPENTRGRANHGWLDTRHTFSFASYFDAEKMGFRSLRVLNEDRVQPGGGFPTHSHQNMEIISYVVGGTLSHKDSMGNVSTIGTGEIQCMTAGSGVHHSEFNGSDTEKAHFLQIWVLPDEKDLEPTYEQRHVPDLSDGALHLVASRDGANGSLRVHQDMELYVARSGVGTLTHCLSPGRHAWVQVVDGGLRVNDVELRPGDGAAISEETELRIEGLEAENHFLVFDLG